MRLIWLGGAWLVGIALGPGAWGWWPPALCGGAALLALAVLYPGWRGRLLFAALTLATLALGAWRGGAVRLEPADLPAGTIEAVRGTVVGWPERANRGDRAALAVEEVRIAGRWQGAAARVRAEAPLYPALGAGDYVELWGYYRPVEAITLAGFRDYLRRRGFHGQFRGFRARILAAGARDDAETRRVATVARVEERLRRHIPQPEAALVTGVLLGNDNLLPKGQRDAFNATGTSHIMALSGWNIALVAGLCATLGRRLGRARSWLWQGGSIAAIWGYTLLVGGGPTLIRAAIMGTLYLLAGAVGRRGDALTALVLAAAAMTAATPGVILDLGFQLSCAATAGLILCAGRLARALRRLPAPVAAGAAASLSAELFTLPLTLHHFGRLSTVTLPANLLIEPLVPAIMAGGALTALASAVADRAGALCGLATWLPARLLLEVVERLGALAWASRGVATPGLPVVAACYVVLGAALTVPTWAPPALAAGRAALDRPRPALAPLLYGVGGGLIAGLWLALLLAAP